LYAQEELGEPPGLMAGVGPEVREVKLERHPTREKICSAEGDIILMVFKVGMEMDF
jgi:hypothetical protein